MRKEINGKDEEINGYKTKLEMLENIVKRFGMDVERVLGKGDGKDGKV